MSPKSAEKLDMANAGNLQNSIKKPYKLEIVWRNVALFFLLHVAALIGVYQVIFISKWQTSLATFLFYLCGSMGITAGVHRLWSHRSYKAKMPLQILLLIFNTLSFQNSVHEWVRDHRMHHKYSETHADPHNATRGFFFAHMGWLLCRKHPEVKEKGKGIDMSDIESDPVLMFQKRHYLKLVLLINFIIPTVLPWYLWDESPLIAFYTCVALRYTFTLHATWLINSAAHMWGMKPYDKSISPAENMFTAIFAHGEGWHNYHHTFPWDYATSELGYKVNLTTIFIDFMALLGQVYDRKKVAVDVVAKRARKYGDGSSPHCKGHHHHEEQPHPDDQIHQS